MKVRIAMPAARAQGFTLPEVMIAMTILIIVVGGILSAHVFGLRMFQVSQAKLTATEWSRRTFGKITDEVRAGNVVTVGNMNGTNGTFEGLLDGERQEGTGLLIYPTTDTNSYILYFLNGADQTFRRATDKQGSAVILADSVTNSVTFSARDFSGNVLSNTTSSNSPVIHLQLLFYQPQRFLQDANQYKLETSMTRRAQ